MLKKAQVKIKPWGRQQLPKTVMESVRKQAPRISQQVPLLSSIAIWCGDLNLGTSRNVLVTHDVKPQFVNRGLQAS